MSMKHFRVINHPNKAIRKRANNIRRRMRTYLLLSGEADNKYQKEEFHRLFTKAADDMATLMQSVR